MVWNSEKTTNAGFCSFLFEPKNKTLSVSEMNQASLLLQYVQDKLSLLPTVQNNILFETKVNVQQQPYSSHTQCTLTRKTNHDEFFLSGTVYKELTKILNLYSMSQQTKPNTYQTKHTINNSHCQTIH
jgi:hypothetical protein